MPNGRAAHLKDVTNNLSIQMASGNLPAVAFRQAGRRTSGASRQRQGQFAGGIHPGYCQPHQSQPETLRRDRDHRLL